MAGSINHDGSTPPAVRSEGHGGKGIRNIRWKTIRSQIQDLWFTYIQYTYRPWDTLKSLQNCIQSSIFNLQSPIFNLFHPMNWWLHNSTLRTPRAFSYDLSAFIPEQSLKLVGNYLTYTILKLFGQSLRFIAISIYFQSLSLTINA